MKKYIFSVLLICSFIISSGCSSASEQQIDAHQYKSFWIWGNISSAPYLSEANEIYILQGEMNIEKNRQISVFSRQGIAPFPPKSMQRQKVWIVIRSHHLAWSHENIHQVLSKLKQWELKGHDVIGLQIDFDSPTHNLKTYARFLQAFRKQLPTQYQLSITGLLDWTNIQDSETLSLLKENIDELVIQTYQGTHTVPDYAQYLSKISKLQLPYKLGLVQHGMWKAPDFLEKDQNFKGYVVFLLRTKV